MFFVFKIYVATCASWICSKCGFQQPYIYIYLYNVQMLISAYIYIFFIGWTTSASGNEKQALEQLQRNRGSMAAVLQLQELPEIEPDSSDLNHMRVQELVT